MNSFVVCAVWWRRAVVLCTLRAGWAFGVARLVGGGRWRRLVALRLSWTDVSISTMLTVFDVGADGRRLTVLGSLRIIGCAKVARRDVTPPLPRRGERAITPAPTVASPGAAARLGPLGAILHSLYENVIRTPRRNPISPIGRANWADWA